MTETIRNLKRLEDKTKGSVLRTALRVSMKPVAVEAKSLASRSTRSGSLRASLALGTTLAKKELIRRKADGIAFVRVKPSSLIVKYAGEKKERKINPGRYAHLIETGSSHAAAKPFAAPALEKNQAIITRTLGRELVKAFARVQTRITRARIRRGR